MRSASVLTGGMTLAAWAAPTTISIYTMSDIALMNCARRNTYLDRFRVDQETVQLLESFASAIGLVKCDIGDAAADRVGTVRELDSLYGTNGSDEVLLMRGNLHVSQPKAEVWSRSPIRHRAFPKRYGTRDSTPQVTCRYQRAEQ